MSLHVKSKDVPERMTIQSGASGEGSMVVTKAYGNECSLMIAVRRPGYTRSRMFTNQSRLTSLWTGKSGSSSKTGVSIAKKGDFQRIPANKIHWAWNRSDGDALVAEAHAPALIGGRAGEGAVGLFDEAEAQQVRGSGVNRFIAYDSAATESKYPVG